MDHQSWKDWGNKRTINAPDDAVIRTFPQHLIFLEDGIFKQTRSGPNWQGGVLSLSTCKHYMRTSGDAESWVGSYLAGFTPKSECGENYLLFLAEISQVFDSNYDMGLYLNQHHRDAWTQKIATQNQFGDVYLAKRKLSDKTKYNPKNYYIPHGHCRMEMDKKWGVPKWNKDIDYTNPRGGRPFCFVFANVHMFKRPVFMSTRPLHRSGYKGTISDLKRGVTRV